MDKFYGEYEKLEKTHFGEEHKKYARPRGFKIDWEKSQRATKEAYTEAILAAGINPQRALNPEEYIEYIIEHRKELIKPLMFAEIQLTGYHNNKPGNVGIFASINVQGTLFEEAGDIMRILINQKCNRQELSISLIETGLIQAWISDSIPDSNHIITDVTIDYYY